MYFCFIILLKQFLIQLQFFLINQNQIFVSSSVIVYNILLMISFKTTYLPKVTVADNWSQNIVNHMLISIGY